MDGGPVPPEKLRVVIADDHAFYRQGLAELLTRSGIDVVGQAPNGHVAIAMVDELAPDVAVIDLNMPMLAGTEVIRLVTERNPACRVIVVTVSETEADLTEAILAGASGYVLKDGAVEEIVAGIKAVAAGESPISSRIASTLLRAVRDRDEAEHEPRLTPLSRRELEVLKLVAEGKSNQEIGEALVIGQSTVRNHISSILTKLHVHNRVQAAVRAIKDQMV